MPACSGEEIPKELLLHLQFPLMPTISESLTIPAVTLLATATLLPRIYGDRPALIPSNSASLALLGQFVELHGESSLEHVVQCQRGSHCSKSATGATERIAQALQRLCCRVPQLPHLRK
jgi:hypothetical protein